MTIYLGGLLPLHPKISRHLASRAEVGGMLRKAVPTTEIRAGPIIGAGSTAFEIVRTLTESHPVMIVPRCVRNQVQPIALTDVLSYLLAALDREPLGILEVGGDRLSFAHLVLTYAHVRGLHRRIIPTPMVTARLVAAWVVTVTPVPRIIVAPLLQGMRAPVVADTRPARLHFRRVRAMVYRRAVELALESREFAAAEPHASGMLGG